MRLRHRATSRARRVLLGGFGLGWLIAAVGALVKSPPTLAVGLAVVGAGSAVIAKLSFESHGDLAKQSALEAADLAEVRRRLRRQDAELSDLRATAAAHANLLQGLGDVPQWRAEIERRHADMSRHMEQRVGFVLDALGESTATTRAAVSRLRRRLPSDVTPEALGAIESTDLEAPLLSIAIPSFNRPEELRSCLDSVAREIQLHGNDVVEVCITDDQSTDPDAIEIAAQFAIDHHFASLRVNGSNLGLERNLLNSVKPCRGRFVIILGNDDMLVPDALRTVVADLGGADTPPLWVFGKLRVDQRGASVASVPGSTPIELAAGDVCRFDSFAAAARNQGLFSTFGFISQVAFERAPFVTVDGAPYLGLTMYPQVFVLAQAFASAAVGYRNIPIVFHRTPTHAQKFAESLGRPEQTFMTGGRVRASRYFGSTYAASLQRAIDRGALRLDDVIHLPERLMGSSSLVDWIDQNRRDPQVPTLPADVTADADRFFSAVHAIRQPSPTIQSVPPEATSDRRGGQT